jgi:hypothetical protein
VDRRVCHVQRISMEFGPAGINTKSSWENMIQLGKQHSSTDTGIVGNETADQVARTRTGCKHPFIAPEPACGISIGVAKLRSRSGRTGIIKHIGNP